jgi:murein L,D-transpeptidase YcbB/YkuD
MGADRHTAVPIRWPAWPRCGRAEARHLSGPVCACRVSIEGRNDANRLRTGGRHRADRTRRGVVAAVTTCSLLLAAPAVSQSAELAVKARIESMRATGVLQLNGSTLPASDLVAALYERRGFTLLWNVPERRAALRAALMQMRDDGLDPTIYHFAALTASDASVTGNRAAASKPRRPERIM